MPLTSENVLSKRYLRTYALFDHSQLLFFHKTSLQIENDKISAAEINDILEYFILQCIKRDTMMDLYR